MRASEATLARDSSQMIAARSANRINRSRINSDLIGSCDSFDNSQSQDSSTNSQPHHLSKHDDKYNRKNYDIFSRNYSLRILKHTMIDEKNPFILYAIEIRSNFSKYVVLKQFKNFVRLQQELVKMKDYIVEVKGSKDNKRDFLTFEKLIPKLPSSIVGLIFKTVPSQDSIERQKDSLTKYCQALIDLIAKCSSTQCGPGEEDELEEAQVSNEKTNITSRSTTQKHNSKEWLNIIVEFFQLRQMEQQEQEKALKLQRFFKNIKKNKMKKKFLQLLYLQRGYTVSVLDIPTHVFINLISYLTSKEKFKIQQVCSSIRSNALHPSLWREVNLFSKQTILPMKFGNFIHRSDQLMILSLKFCLNVTGDTLAIIAEEANPFFLRELYLDGCDKINDQALQHLVAQKRVIPELPDSNIFFNGRGIYMHNFHSIATTPEEMVLTMKEIGLGGARGLEVISLAECRNIQDVGVAHLKQLKYLNKVVLLGCLNVKDEGVKELAKNLKYLEDIDIGGTNITADSLRDLVALCLNLKKVNISGCKRLNASDDKILLKNKINVEGGDDVFRFYLFPEQFSDLPKITSSILKTRGTLSMHKVYKYLLKKLSAEKVVEDLPDDQFADSVVEILCNGIVMNPYIQLKFVKDKYWAKSDQLLVLHYRRKEVANTSEVMNATSHDYYPKKPPLWVPDHLALNCLKCEREFSAFRRIHHCRNCGKCFCVDCCNNWCPIENYGYFNPVRICSDCKHDLSKAKETE